MNQATLFVTKFPNHHTFKQVSNTHDMVLELVYLFIEVKDSSIQYRNAQPDCKCCIHLT